MLCLLALVLAGPALAQDRAPIIDMQLHAGISPDMKTGLRVPWVTQFPPWDPAQGPWGEVWMQRMTEPPCDKPIWSPGSETAVMEQTIVVMQRHNIIGVLSGPPDKVHRWQTAAPDRFIPSLQFNMVRDDYSPADLHTLFTEGGFKVLGEISNQ